MVGPRFMLCGWPSSLAAQSDCLLQLELLAWLGLSGVWIAVFDKRVSLPEDRRFSRGSSSGAEGAQRSGSEPGDSLSPSARRVPPARWRWRERRCVAADTLLVLATRTLFGVGLLVSVAFVIAVASGGLPAGSLEEYARNYSFWHRSVDLRTLVGYAVIAVSAGAALTGLASLVLRPTWRAWRLALVAVAALDVVTATCGWLWD
jgi:hypothetical protein